MESFGLGLILSFTDNATGGMNSAANSLQRLSGMANSASNSVNSFSAQMGNLSLAGMGLNMVGEQFTSVGSSIVETLTGIISKVNETGTTMLTARTQLSKLYAVQGDTTGKLSLQAANDILKKAKSYAKESIFNFEDLLPSIIMLKANAIEAFDEITSSSGKSKQNILDYAADLAAFNPQMKNSYGTGIQAAAGALNEYISEGNDMSLKRGASLDITGILGEDKGGSIKERSRQVADLLEKLNMVGTVSSMAGTPMQRLSNAGDVLFDVLSRISDSGVFDKFTELVATFTDYIFAIPDEELQAISENIGAGLSSLMNPIISLIKFALKGVDVLRGILREHPALSKLVVTFTALAGAGLLAFGTLLKFSGSLFMLTAGLSQLSNIGNLFRGSLALMAKGILSVAASILPFALMSALAYVAWKTNMFGIQTAVTETSNVLGLAFRAIKASWDGEMTMEEFDWVQKAGLLPLVTMIQKVKHSLAEMFEGIKQGFNEAIGFVLQNTTGLVGMGRTVKDVIDKVSELISKYTGFELKDSWRNAGVVIGRIAGALFMAIPVIKLFGIAFSIATSPLSLFLGACLLAVKGIKYIKDNVKDAEGALTPFGEKVKSVMGKIGSVFDKLFLKKGNSNFSELFSSLVDGFDGNALKEKLCEAVANIDYSKVIGTVVIGLIAVFKPSAFLSIGKTAASGLKASFGLAFKGLGGLGSLLINGVSRLFPSIGIAFGSLMTPIKTALSGLGGKLGGLFSSASGFLGPVVSAIGGWPIAIGAAVGGALCLGTTLLGDSKEEAKANLLGFFDKIWGSLPEGVKEPLRKVGETLKGWINDIGEKMGMGEGEGWNAFKQWCEDTFDAFYDTGQRIKEAVQPVIDWLSEAWDGWLGELVGNVVSFFGKIVEFIQVSIGVICDIFMYLWQFVEPIFDGLGEAVNGFIEVINGLIDFFIGVFTGDWEKVWEGVKEIFEGIWDMFWGLVKAALNNVIGVINQAIDWIINTILDAINAVINLWIGAFNSITEFLGIDFKLDNVNMQVPQIPYLNTGGYIKDEGISYLHPNEVVINDPTTRSLQAFLAKQNSKDKEETPVMSKEPIMSIFNYVSNDNSSIVNPVQAPLNEDNSDTNKRFNYESSLPAYTPNKGGDSYDIDNSVTFDKGSIIIQVQNASSPVELEGMVDKLIKMIERKQNLRAMAIRS